MAFWGTFKLLLASSIILQLITNEVEGRSSPFALNRLRRFVGGLGEFQFAQLNQLDSNHLDQQNQDDEQTQDYKQDQSDEKLEYGPSSRQSKNYPNFPQENVDNDNYEQYLSTRAPLQEPEYTFSGSSYPSLNITEPESSPSFREDMRYHFNKRVLPWINNAWSQTKNFFKKHYNTVSDQLKK